MDAKVREKKRGGVMVAMIDDRIDFCGWHALNEMRKGTGNTTANQYANSSAIRWLTSFVTE